MTKDSKNYLAKQIEQFGPKNLNDQELLCYILSQINQKQAPQLVTKYFEEYTNLWQLKELFKDEWANFFENQAQYVEVLVEFARRLNTVRPLKLGYVYSSQQIGQKMARQLRHLQQEVLVCLYLDTKNQVLAQETLFKGTLNNATVHPREIFKEALRYSAARFMVIHNHRETRL